MATLTISFTVPDANATDVLNTITDELGFTGTDPSGLTETRAACLKRTITDNMKQLYVKRKKIIADTQAETTASQITFS